MRGPEHHICAGRDPTSSTVSSRMSPFRPFPFVRTLAWVALALLVIAPGLLAQRPAPDRRAGEGDGPFDMLVIRGAILIDGTGGPPRGPVNITIRGNRITQ